jgi:flagellar motor switch protein FliN/FliY
MSSTPTPPPADNRADAVDGKKLELLLDVSLALTLRFGQKDLTLREVLELSSGSVIELDRHVEEPAELLLGERVIARGQVVIVDGNYGIKITDVPA